MRLRACVMVGLVALGLAAGCGRDGPIVAPKPTTDSRTIKLKGVVRKVDVASGEVTIAHEAIPGFMPAMTMPFTLKNKASLEDIQPGDEVEGTLRVESVGGEVKDYDLVDLTATGRSIEPPSAPIGVGSTGPDPALLKPGDLMPDLAVTTQEGRTLRLSELRGKVVALTFIYTRCPLPEFCPAMDAKFADLARRLSVVPGRADRVRLLSVSFDPEHDTPTVLAEHARRRGARPPLWTFAVASHEELDRVAGPLGLTVAPGSREISHNLRTVVIGPDGRLVRLESGQGWITREVLRTITDLISTAPK
jgi:protein SCO1/2